MSIQEALPLLTDLLTYLAAVQSLRAAELQLDIVRLQLRHLPAKRKRQSMRLRER